ncbi:CBS domain-containing protein [Pyrobaculum sp. 3827-6]|uniref:CBS domain-containing protein n=1 Tax=Pyrobaculum sp. 3827-6 TaxID=2983604 RepID=UPI0021DA6B5C|nr:CBS domain-containing protein [Pyrobaculum sp. 3827-6]MCU7786740.1 CBS domain-containing protein [Pyrobaculum sp. 3827-6]
MEKIDVYIRRQPIYVTEGATVRDVVRLMASNNIGLVVVVDSGRRPVAVVSERDVIKALDRGVSMDEKAVNIGTRGPLLTAKRGDDVYKVVKAMRERGIRHVVVLNDDGTLAGVVSIRDLIEDKALKAIGEKVWWPPPEE